MSQHKALLFSTLFNDFQRFATICNDFQRFSTVFNGFQRVSTFFNVFQRFLTFFNDFQRFLGARPYRGVSRQNLRKVRKKSDTTPTEKPTGAPPKVGFQASSCPSDFRRTFCSSTSAGEGPILAEKVSAKSRPDIGSFFRTRIALFPRQQCQFWTQKRGTPRGNSLT